MSERNIIAAATTTGIVAAFTDFYTPLLPYLTLAAALVMLDLRFGIAAAKRRIVEAKKTGKDYEPLRFSRAARRTINKLTDYVCWVTLAGLFGQTYGTVLGVPALSALMLIIVYGIEVVSCFNNYFFARGIEKRVKINFNKFFNNKLDIIDIDDKNQNNPNHDRNETTT